MLKRMCPWLSWIERLATDQKVGGSNPSRHAKTRMRLHSGFLLFFYPGMVIYVHMLYN